MAVASPVQPASNKDAIDSYPSNAHVYDHLHLIIIDISFLWPFDKDAIDSYWLYW